jgi:putative transposase
MTTTSTITPELLDQLLSNYKKPEDLTGEDGLFKQLKKALIERALGAELTEHLGYEKGDPAGRGSGNSRNGTSSKTVLTEDGEIEIAIPRDRAGSFEPQLIGKGQTRFDGFDDKILSLYARGMTVREIQGHLAELYGTEVSPDLISRVTDAVLDEVREWQNRPLDQVYPVVFFDALLRQCVGLTGGTERAALRRNRALDTVARRSRRTSSGCSIWWRRSRI